MRESQLASPGRIGTRSLNTALAAIFIVFFLAAPIVAQSGGGPPAPRNGSPFGRPSSDDDEIPTGNPMWREQQLKVLNAQRQKELVADTYKLLKLAQDLNAEISKAKSDSLTPDQLRRIADIEKLAHSVKEKMSTSVRGTSIYPLDPFHRMQ